MTILNLDALQSALSGLATTKARIDTVSRNISNASTDGYVRKLQAATVTDIGTALAGPIQRSVSESINRSLRDTSGEVNRLDVTVDMLGNVEAVMGTPSEATSLSTVIAELQSAFQNLSVSPQKEAAYGSTIAAADDVARTFRSLYGTVEEQRSQANIQFKAAVDQANETLVEIQETNHSISVGAVGDPSDLQDRRDVLLQRLTGLMEVTTYTKPNGEIAIYTKNGEPLLDATLRKLDPAELGAVQPPGGPPLFIIRSGTIGGLLQMRDIAMPATETQLDEMARSLTEEFRGLGIELFKDAGSVTLDTIADPTQANGFAARINVNDAYETTPALIRDGNSATPLGPADTTFIDKAVAFFLRGDVVFHPTPGLPPTGNLIQVATDFVAQRGSDRVTAQSELDHQKSLQQTFQDKQSQVSGVSVDDELASLIQLQQSYSAAARIIDATRTLLDDLLQSVR
jgi:flagellar hook-associated protein 1